MAFFLAVFVAIIIVSVRTIYELVRRLMGKAPEPKTTSSRFTRPYRETYTSAEDDEDPLLYPSIDEQTGAADWLMHLRYTDIDPDHDDRY